MGLVEKLGVGQEGAQAGLGAEVQRPPAIFGARKIGRVGIAEDAAA